MKFTVKLSRVGMGIGIYLPKSILESYKLGDDLEIEILEEQKEPTERPNVLNSQMDRQSSSSGVNGFRINLKTGAYEHI